MSITIIQPSRSPIRTSIRALNLSRLGRDLPLLPLLILVPFIAIAVFAKLGLEAPHAEVGKLLASLS